MTGPLDGLRILDLSAVISGPFATMVLADQGADVIKVEPPVHGDYVRAGGNRKAGLPANFLNNNRNKRSITIDLKSQQGIAVLKRLVARADAFVQNFRPGVIDRMGLGEPAIREIRPDIVYASISGFGENGPFVNKPVYDPIVQALSGLASVQGGSDQERPRLIRTIVPDKVTALTASQAITAALLARARTGVGQHVRVSMLDAVIAFLWSSDMGSQTFVGEDIPQQRAASFIDLIYEMADGYMSVSVMTNAQWQGLTRAFDRPEWLEDPRFLTPALRDANLDARLRLTQEVLRTRRTDEWMSRLEAAGVPCAPVLTRTEMIEHPQVMASGIVMESEHPQAGRLRQARAAARFERTPTSLRRGAPLLGAHTDEVLGEAGFSDAEIAALRADGIVGG